MSDVRIKLPKKNEEEETYACRECGLLKLSTEFRFKNKAKGILHPGCKDCIRKRDDARTYNYGDTKKCTGCKNVLPIDDFGINRVKTGQRKARCRDCVTLFRNKIKRSETDRDRYHNRGGREKAKVSYEKYKPKRNANRREKTKNDPQYRLDHNYRTRIYHALRQNGQSRTGKIKYLGMSQDIYNQWLEYQFDENMTRDNYGTYWEIDHVKPCASFDLTKEENIYDCFDWKNTRPLEKTANTSKGDTVDMNLVEEHKWVVQDFILDKSLEGEFVDNSRHSNYTYDLYGV